MRGKVFCNISGYISVWDHPRMCGEKTFLEQKRPPRLGSPPHVRGKVRKAKKAVRCTWITPACAGKRNWQCSTTRPEKDHPRMCGEKGSLPMLLDSQRGSPPHVRGKEIQKRGVKVALRITPACAGKSPFLLQSDTTAQDHPRMCGEKKAVASARAWLIRDHPRMCGEKLNIEWEVAEGEGSPPHVRGKD